MNIIEMQLNEKIIKPGGRVQGSVTWNLEKLPKDFEVRLFWVTRGIGTEDLQVVEKVSIEPRKQGEFRLEFTLPEGPYSFSGKLISLVWAVECVANPSHHCARQEIIVSPTGGEILLGKDHG